MIGICIRNINTSYLNLLCAGPKDPATGPTIIRIRIRKATLYGYGSARLIPPTYRFDGGELLLVLVHEIRQTVDEGAPVPGVHLTPLSLIKRVISI